MKSLLISITLVTLVICLFLSQSSAYKIGVGQADVTGPIAEVAFMGYAEIKQKGSGLHTRLAARAFVIADDSAQNIVAFVSSDTCMIFHGVRMEVLKRLQQQIPNVFTENNVLLSGTHTHGGPGGFSYNALYDLTILGFQKDNFDVIVTGHANAIMIAYKNMMASAPGATIDVTSGTLLNSNINRSPTAYLNNPPQERAGYPYDVDKDMVVLRMRSNTGVEVGMLNWFAVHGTSMTKNNSLVSSDNKGMASSLFERMMNGDASMWGQGTYVAAFAQTNSGDVSPRTRGAFCSDGSPCEQYHSTCGGKNEDCNGIGPGNNEFEATAIIGAQQFAAAVRIAFNETTDQGKYVDEELHLLPPLPLKIEVLDIKTSERLQGPVDYRHEYVDMEHLVINGEYSPSQKSVNLCLAAMGDSFAAGTSDGPGALSFIQGDNSTTSNPFWNFLAHFLSNPAPEQIACQAPKPILFNTGGISFPGPWTSGIQPIQILRIGQLFILGVPAEFTTMSGRRLRASTEAALQQVGINNPIIVIAEISNNYGGYVATPEEYIIQRYEAASTIYGPNTLNGYRQEFGKLARAIGAGTSVAPGPTPADLSGKTFNFQPGVIMDSAPFGKKFGAVMNDIPAATYSVASHPTVTASFWGASPRNNIANQRYFFVVERLVNGQYTSYRNDGDLETKFSWQRHSISESIVTATWEIPSSTPLGQYRFHIFGQSKNLLGAITPYEGFSRTFSLTA